MKDINQMNLAELANALQRYEFDMLNDQVASRLRELHQEHAKTIEDLRDILEDRRRTAEEEHGRNMNEANL